MQRITKDKAEKAAWPGTQPVFDALRRGCTELERQAKHLHDARDTIKDVHIAMNTTEFGSACGSVRVKMIKISHFLDS